MIHLHDNPHDRNTINISDLGRVLRRRWWLLALPLLVAAAGAWLITARTAPTYQADAEVVIRTQESANLFPLSDATELYRSPSAEAGFLASTEFVRGAQAAAGSNLAVMVDIGNVDGRIEPSFIQFIATGPDATEVATVAQAWADTYISLRNERDIADNEQTISTLQDSLDELSEERAEALVSLEAIDRAIALTDEPGEIAQLTSQRLAISQSLEASLSPIDFQIEAVGTELANLRLLEDFLRDEQLSARVNRIPVVPDTPVAPSLLANLVLALAGATMVGGALVLTVEALDTRLRDIDDVVRATHLVNLASIPSSRRDKGDPLTLQHGPLAEGFQRLASSVNLAAFDDARVFAFTSAGESEAKSTTVARLGQVLAKQGFRTIVVGGDLRRPTLAGRFEVDYRPGLGEVLMGAATLDDTVVEPEGFPGLSILPAGHVPMDTNPADLLASGRLSSTVHALRERYDRVLIDCPPVLPVVDAIEIAGRADAVVLNVFAGKVKRTQLQQALSLLERSGDTDVIGFVITGSDGAIGYTSSYYRSNAAPSRALTPAPRVVPPTEIALPTTAVPASIEPAEGFVSRPIPEPEVAEVSLLEEHDYDAEDDVVASYSRIHAARKALKMVTRA